MSDYFTLLATEFAAQAAQIKQFVRSHGPSIGAAHEIVLRSFLRKYLPRWVSVGHGFISDRGNALSKECDILIYNSMFYAPLYQIEDFLVLAPESVIAAIEVKCGLDKNKFKEAIANLASIKTINPAIDASLFIYKPPRLETISAHIEAYDFSGIEAECLPDTIYGMSRYVLHRAPFYSDTEFKKPVAIGYLTSGAGEIKSQPGFVFECFYYNLYSKVERAITTGVKSGIDYDWKAKIDQVNNPPMIPLGRGRYASPGIGLAQDSKAITAKKLDS